MKKGNFKEEIKDIVAEIIEIDDFRDDENFINDLGVDSMMALEIVASLEKEYRIQIPEEKLPEIQTFNDVLDIVKHAIKPTNI